MDRHVTDTTRARARLLLPYLVTAALFAAGGWALYRMLAPVHLRDVMEMVRATPLRTILLALICTFGGYVALIGYDWSALRYIGRKLPLPVIAAGGFLGYAIGNNLGAGPVTGGAVRYRIYSALGLSPYDIAAISVFGSVAFGSGASLIGLGALAWHPHALDAFLPWPPGVIRWSALAIIAALCAAMLALSLRQAPFTLRGLTFRPPSPGLMAGQFVFTAVETLLSALVLYILLPTGGGAFPTFLAVFSVAVMAGVLSHVPGGVGVFETIIIAALPATVPVSEAAAGLLLFRMVYYLVPFAVALALMALAELRMARGPARAVMIPVFRAISALTPLAMAAMVFASGAMMMVASLLPPTSAWTEELELILPLSFLEGGALLSSALGACLLVIAHGLLRRVEGAWWLALFALIVGAGASIAHGVDYDRAAILGLATLILLPARREFHRATRLTRNVLSLRWLLLMLSLGLMIVGVLFFAHKATPYSAELWWQFAEDDAAPRALRALLVGLIVMGLVLLRYALRPGRLEATLPDAATLDRAQAILRDSDAPEATVALSGDKALLFSPSGASFLMYRTQGRSWVALHEPVGRAGERAALAWEFHDAAYAANARPVFYAVSAGSAPLWIDMGLALHKLGEEAVVDLSAFSLDGSARKRLRTTHNRAKRDGLAFEISLPPHAPGLLDRLERISDAWLAARSAGEKGFSVGAFDRAYLDRTPIALIRLGEGIVAFANLWQTGRRTRATLDLMRHVEDAPAGVMEFLFTELLLHFKAEGFAEFSLGNAPLSGLEARRGARLSTQLGAFVYQHGGAFYNFEGLRSFKDKFDPEWRPVYVAVPPRVNLVAVAADLVALIGGGVGRTLGRKPG
ncbi:bifunctional lysylphosphatidylglycerol flippase/synthetase MprF [Salipiger sp.]|uniref:bifunctional lysylphosphatidylglycerol flippase/synthetase MprF n=1 Tax=Salipiger sp. TaxID=2078585 RepID=UPI003A969FDC